ncbi:MAG TPA: ATP-dependent DNA helicase RecG, partial [Nitrosomonas sp.]|nr:ATP-dependent DNA helicase RecG [Nitrosomonas sp.]
IFEHNDGFEIAQQDLRLRGPGELLGTRQSGIPLLRFANLEEDKDLLEAARNVAEQLLNENPKVVEFYLTWWLASRNVLLQA